MRGKVLLGWLTRDDAVNFLQERCVFDPPLSVEQAEVMWAEKRAVVEALPPRAAVSPEKLEMTAAEREAGARFLAFLRSTPAGLGAVRDVVKINPTGLVIRQFDVNLDRANLHARHV